MKYFLILLLLACSSTKPDVKESLTVEDSLWIEKGRQQLEDMP